MREVVRAAGVAGEPPADLLADAVETGLLGVLDGFGEPALPDQVPVPGEHRLLGRLVEVAGGAELRGSDDSLLQPPRLVHDRVALPDDEVGRERVGGLAAPGLEGAFLGGADGGNPVRDQSHVFRGEHVAGRRRVEHAESDVGAVGDVLEEAQHALAAVHLHRRRLQVADVGTGGLRVLGQLEAVLGRGGAGAGLDHGVRGDRACLLDRHLEQLPAFVHRQRPPLGDPAGEPEHRVPEVADAVPDECPVGVEVDVVTVGAAERRVQRVADAVQTARGGPVLRVTCSRHGCSLSVGYPAEGAEHEVDDGLDVRRSDGGLGDDAPVDERRPDDVDEQPDVEIRG